MRLNAYLARAGVASRRKADELIKSGRVTVNGEPGQLNTFVARRDRVELDGQPLARQPLAYVLLHKPAGVVTTASDPQGRPTVVELVVGRFEDLDDVVATHRHEHADELAAGLVDDALALLDPLAPRGQAGDALRRPAHQRDVVRHGETITRCV